MRNLDIVAVKQDEGRESICARPESDVFLVTQRDFDGLQEIMMDRFAFCKNEQCDLLLQMCCTRIQSVIKTTADRSSKTGKIQRHVTYLESV